MEYTIEPNKEGIINKTYCLSDTSYKILNIDKQSTDDSLNIYRSIITDPLTDKVMCFSPPKSVSMEVFISKCPGMVGVTATRIVEGTMINLFYDPRVESWEIASKSAVGCNYWYFRTKYDVSNNDEVQLTFRDMFIDALGASYGSQLNDIPLIQCLDKSRTYSFVVQHPNNHIVLPIAHPTLYLIAVYQVSDNNIRIVEPDAIFSNSTVLQPDACSVGQHEDVHLIDYTNVGVMLYHEDSGLRTTIENPQYINLRDFRGNNPNLQYQYLCLSQTGKVKEYLNVFPMYKKIFFGFNKQSAEFIRTIHNAYVTYFIRKRGKDVEIEKSIFRHICTLHNEIYLPSIESGNSVIITCKIVADYFNRMEPKSQLYHLNYQNRAIQNV